MASDFLLNSIERAQPGTVDRWRQEAAERNMTLDDYIQHNTHYGRGNFHEGGGTLLGGLWQGTLGSRVGRINVGKALAFTAGGIGAANAGAGGGGFVPGGGPSLANPSSGWLKGGLRSIFNRSGGGGGNRMSFISDLFSGNKDEDDGGGGGFWGELLKTGVGTVLGSVLNRQNAPGKDLSRSPYESGDLQRYLPPELRAGTTGPLIGAGIQGIGELLRNPGGLSPNVLDSIRPRLAEESQTIAQNYRGIASNQAGALARSNAPTSIKGALQSALDVAQERAQRGARNEALSQSDTMRRADLERVFQILDAILQFQQAGRGTATAGLGPGTALQSQKTAAMMALVSSLLGSGAKENDNG